MAPSTNSPIINTTLSKAAEMYENPNQPNLENASKDFLQSNGVIAKFGFVLLVLIVFLILLKIGTMIIGSLLLPKSDVHLLDGMISGTDPLTISQNPNDNGSKPIKRSDDRKEGLEFTWSIWVYIKQAALDSSQYRHIFHKGNNDIKRENCGNTCGVNFPNNGPGLYLNPGKNSMTVFMNTFDNSTSDEIVVDDLPLDKWLNVVIRGQQKTLDVYVNGAIVKSHEMSSVPKQNYGDVYMSSNGGFDGYSSNLWYYSRALSSTEIVGIVAKGPNLELKSGAKNSLYNSRPPYFSLRWYFQDKEYVE